MNAEEGKTTGYHLFLEPTGALRDELGATIQSLAHQYNAPAFTPHVTLLAQIPGDEQALAAKTAELVSGVMPIELTLGVMQMEDTYFRACYFTVQAPDTLTALHARACELFGMQSAEPYRPHLSLLYGNYPEEAKAPIAEVVKKYEGAAFIAGRVHLYQTSGMPHQWREVRTFPFVAP